MEDPKPILAKIQPLKDQARREGKVLRNNYHGVEFTADQLDEENAKGKFLWGPSNWSVVECTPLNGWSTIESAPKDGTHILGFDPKFMPGEKPVCGEIAWVRDRSWMDKSRWKFFRYPHSGFYPTHWQPLPQGPAGEHCS